MAVLRSPVRPPCISQNALETIREFEAINGLAGFHRHYQGKARADGQLNLNGCLRPMPPFLGVSIATIKPRRCNVP